MQWVDTVNHKLHPKQTLKLGQEEIGASCLENHQRAADKWEDYHSDQTLDLSLRLGHTDGTIQSEVISYEWHILWRQVLFHIKTGHTAVAWLANTEMQHHNEGIALVDAAWWSVAMGATV